MADERIDSLKPYQVTLRISTLVFAVLSLTIGIAGPVFYRQNLIEIFDDFDADLPPLSVWVLSIPAWLQLIICSFATALLIAKEFVFRNYVLPTLINLFASFLTSIWLFVFLIAAWLPFTKILYSVM
ncbi:MAG: hypothetical protein AAF593_06800 [Planctomycetota bacterium]